MTRFIHALGLAMLVCLPLAGRAANPVSQADAPSTIVGVPLMQYFGSDVYDSSPVQRSIAMERTGEMVFGNNDGLVIFDGVSWTQIDINPYAPVYSLARGRDGHVYVAGYDSFGWLEKDASGHLHYRQLMTQAGLHGQQRHVGMVWKVMPTRTGVFFRSNDAMHYLDYAHKHARNWPLPEAARYFWTDGESIYAQYRGQGFGRYVDGKFTLLPGGGYFAKRSIEQVLPMGNWRLLIGIDRLYRSDKNGITPLPGNIGQELKGHRASSVTRLADHGFAIGCIDGTLFQYGADLKLRRRINLGHSYISDLQVDAENGLWAATDRGLYRVDMPSPWSSLSPAQGLPGRTYGFAWYDHALWLAGPSGIRRMTQGPDGPVVTKEDWTSYSAFDLLSTTHGLLIAHQLGMYVLEPGQHKPRTLIDRKQGSAYLMLRSPFNPDRVYAAGSDKLFVLRLESGHWQVSASFDIGNMNISDLIETQPGVLWLDNFRGMPQRWTFDLAHDTVLKRTVFGTGQGVHLDDRFGSLIYRLDHVIHMVSGHKAYRFDGKRFVPDSSVPFSLFKRPYEMSVVQTPLGTYAYTTRQIWLRPSGSTSWRRIDPFPGQAAGYANLRMSQDGVLRLSTWNGLLQYDPGQKMAKPAALSLRLVRTALTAPVGKNAIRELQSPGATRSVTVPPGHGLILRYAMVSMNGVKYRYRIPGLLPTWRDSQDGRIALGPLPAGAYILQVQARALGRHEVLSRRLAFKVLPYWYQRWLTRLAALVALIVICILGTWFMLQRKTRRFERVNSELEARIAERTQELEEANRKLSELATEDALTGVANRRALEIGIRREWMRCRDAGQPMSAMMIDIDRFKAFNDSHGHLKGDQCLKTFAEHLRSQSSPGRELLARYGGEEFALIMPGTPLNQARDRAEQIRQVVADADLGLTVSIGVAALVPQDGVEPESLLQRADVVLYKAKHMGRNRVEVDYD